MKTLIITILLLTFTSGQEKNLPLQIDKIMEIKKPLTELQHYENHYNISNLVIGAGYGIMLFSKIKSVKIQGFELAIIGVLWNVYNQNMMNKSKKELNSKTLKHSIKERNNE